MGANSVIHYFYNIIETASLKLIILIYSLSLVLYFSIHISNIHPRSFLHCQNWVHFNFLFCLSSQHYHVFFIVACLPDISHIFPFVSFIAHYCITMQARGKQHARWDKRWLCSLFAPCQSWWNELSHSGKQSWGLSSSITSKPFRVIPKMKDCSYYGGKPQPVCCRLASSHTHMHTQLLCMQVSHSWGKKISFAKTGSFEYLSSFIRGKGSLENIPLSLMTKKIIKVAPWDSEKWRSIQAETSS